MNTTAICAEQEGRLLDGRFRLLRWLGGSQSSGVYLTEIDGDEAQKAAIKLIAAGDPDAEMCMAGWAAAAGLSHPNLIRVLHTGRCALEGGEAAYAVTEFADEVLAEILPARPLTPQETQEMLGPVLDALSYLHSQGFAHGWLKPSNILVVEDRLKLSADCIPLAGPAGRQLPEPGVYSAPEMGRGELSPASDVWSVGMTLVTALTQHPPAWESAIGAVPIVPSSVPEPFAGIARECLQLDPARRCTLSKIRARLEPATVPEIEVLQIEREEQEPVAQVRFRGRPAVLIATAVLLVGVGAAVLIHSRQSPPAISVADQPPAPAASTAPPPPSAAPPAQAPAPEQKAPAISAAQPEPPTNTAAQDTVKGEVTKRVLPDVLAKAQATIRGKVVIKIRANVDANGDISNVISESPGASKYFTKLALGAAQAWKFTPPWTNGQPVASVWTLRFVFRIDGTDATAAEDTPRAR